MNTWYKKAEENPFEQPQKHSWICTICQPCQCEATPTQPVYSNLTTLMAHLIKYHGFNRRDWNDNLNYKIMEGSIDHQHYFIKNKLVGCVVEHHKSEFTT